MTEEMAECPLCKGQGRCWGAGGCPICTDGKVKASNLARSREQLPDEGWSEAALLRLWRMVTGPMRCRREKITRQRAYLEANEPESRLDRLDRERRESERAKGDEGREQTGRAG